MLKLNKSEIYNASANFGAIASNGENIIRSTYLKLENNIGTINPEAHIADVIEKLKAIRKSSVSYYPMLGQVLNGLTSGIIVPFCLDESPNVLPGYVPFIVGTDKVYVNLIRLGSWSSDKTYFSIMPAYLYRSLESGLIGYDLAVKGYDQKIVTDSNLLVSASKLYANLFSKIIEKIMIVYPNEITADIAHYFIAKFLLIHSLELLNNSTTADIAYKAIKNKTSQKTISEYEMGVNVDYSSLSAFLSTFSDAVFHVDANNTVLTNFIEMWVKTYGFQTLYMPEYFPYFLNFVLSALKDNVNASRLYKFKDIIERDGVDLYNSLTRILS